MGSLDRTDDCMHTYEAPEEELSPLSQKLKISVTGAAGHMGSVICGLLKKKGHYVIASDWTNNQHMAEDEFCDEYHVVDLRNMDNCLEVTRGVDYVFNLATSTEGPGFSESNSLVIMLDNIIIGNNILEAARINGVQRHFHASIVFLYIGTNVNLDAGLAEPQYPSDFEKLDTELLCQSYCINYRFKCRIGRFYCIYGPLGTWQGGRGKAPGAFCLEASTSMDKLEMWGGGLRTRSFPVVRKYAEDVVRLMESDSSEPVFIGRLDLCELGYIGSNEIESENESVEMGLSFEEENLPIHRIPGPEGICGCKEWLRMMCFWINELIEKAKVLGSDSSTNGSPEVVRTGVSFEPASLRAADGKE